MDTIRSCIEIRADKNIEKQREELRSLPVYLHSEAFAKEHGEVDIYRASHRANIECKMRLKMRFPITTAITILMAPA